MFDFGWAEFLVIGFVLLLVVGPQDIPKIMYQCGKALRRLHYMRFALTQQFDDFMQKADQAQHNNDPDQRFEPPKNVNDEDVMRHKDDADFVVKQDDEMDEDAEFYAETDEENAVEDDKKSGVANDG